MAVARWTELKKRSHNVATAAAAVFTGRHFRLQEIAHGRKLFGE